MNTLFLSMSYTFAIEGVQKSVVLIVFVKISLNLQCIHALSVKTLANFLRIFKLMLRIISYNKLERS